MKRKAMFIIVFCLIILILGSIPTKKIFIEFKMEYISEGLLNEEQATAQREKITQAQNNVLMQLILFPKTNVVKYEFIPSMAIDIGYFGYLYLHIFPNIKITERQIDSLF